jgi:RNA polymerase subunit RPABC4/transcription elongation factor Spt4
MSITVLCPKGHRLVANDNNAGKTGRCPVCKAMVSIPLPRTDFLSETAIMGILGSPVLRKSNGISDELGEVATMTVDSAKKTQQHPQVKLCPSCDREIDTGYHICPHCHTYISTLSDF